MELNVTKTTFYMIQYFSQINQRACEKTLPVERSEQISLIVSKYGVRSVP